MRKKKGFDYGKGVYYFTVGSSPRNITINRRELDAAIHTFKQYQSNGKKIEWLGKWDGKKFIEDDFKKVA